LDRNLFNRSLSRLPFLILAAINLVGAFYSENLYDFNTFVRAGQAIVSGGNPYSLPERLSTNLNPPLTLVAFQYLANIDAHTAYTVWRVISFIIYILLVVVLAQAYHNPQTPTHVAWAFAMTGIWYTLLMGQIYVFLLLLCVLAWRLLEKNKLLAAGLLIGLLAAIKPNFLVWPGLLLLGGAWYPAIAAFVTMLLLSLIPLIVYGPPVYSQWIQMLLVYKAAPLATNMSIIGLASRLGLPGVGTALSLLLLVAVAFYVWRRKPRTSEINSLSITAALLATAFAWVGYAILLLPIFFIQRWSKMLAFAAVLLCVPSILVFYFGRQSVAAQFIGGLVYFIPLVLVLADLVMPYQRAIRSK